MNDPTNTFTYNLQNFKVKERNHSSTDSDSLLLVLQSYFLVYNNLLLIKI